MRRDASAQDIEIRFRVVCVAIHFGGEGVHVDALGDLVAEEFAAGLQDIRHKSYGEVFDLIPAHLFRQFFAGRLIYHRVVDDDQGAEDRLNGRLGRGV